jgi:thioredoxin-dependent peroxiredoxin
MAATTVSAAMTGVVNLLSGRGDRHPVELKPGDEAPDFHLPGSDGRWYRLRDFRGHDAVVIAWFPKAFTPGCTRECESLGSSHGVLRGFKVRYFGASVDTAATNRRFAQSLGIDYPILSDPDRSVARAYGVLRANGFPARCTFYIGKDGRILDVDSHVRPSSHGADVAGKLEALGVPTARS